LDWAIGRESMAVMSATQLHVDWKRLERVSGAPGCTRELIRVMREGKLSDTNQEFLRLMLSAAKDIEEAPTSAERRETQKRGVRALQAYIARTKRAQRVENYGRVRAARQAEEQRRRAVDKAVDKLLYIRRIMLPPTEFAECIDKIGPSNGPATLEAALEHVGRTPEPAAGEYLVDLAKKVSRAAHERRRTYPTLPRERAMQWGECVACSERRYRCVLPCGHAASCPSCVYQNCCAQLARGVAPACPLCRAKLSVPEICVSVAPYNLSSPRPRTGL